MRLHLPDRGERGAIAIMTAFLVVALMAVAALGVDITSQVNQRQKLHDTTDAAALAGAYSLPNGTNAKAAALAFAANNYPGAPVPVVALFCVVASIGSGPWRVDTAQIPGTCDPKVEKASSYPNARCNASICSIPCNGATDVCNVIQVGAAKPVPFAFAPVIGINQGSTGSVTSAACKGPCGKSSPNPMDVVVVADRTGSMSSTDITAMISGIKNMFTVMTPSQQYVALGTIGRSAQAPASTTCGSGGNKALSEPSGSASGGPWVPVPFSSDYLTGTTTNPSSKLVNAVECLKNSSSTQTHQASAMKASARYLLGLDAMSYPAGPARTGTIRKAIIFETDGEPNESATSGVTTLSPAGDIESNNGETSCSNLKAVANYAKTATPPILVITVGYNVSSAKCNGSGSSYVKDVLASAASPDPSGVASAANTNCSDTSVGGGRDQENHDGDNYFCASSGTDMGPIFVTALGQILSGSRLIKLP